MAACLKEIFGGVFDYWNVTNVVAGGICEPNWGVVCRDFELMISRDVLFADELVMRNEVTRALNIGSHLPGMLNGVKRHFDGHITNGVEVALDASSV